MSHKKIEFIVMPQNEEWINLIPNMEKNKDIIFNKLIELAVNDGLILDAVAASLTVADLFKFKASYSKMQSKRAEFFDEVGATNRAPKVSKRQSKIDETVESEVEAAQEQTIPVQPIKKEVKKMTHGFDEDSF